MATPKVPLGDLSEKEAVKPWAQELKLAIDRFGEGDQSDVDAAERGLKLLACVLKSALRDASKELREQLEESLRDRHDERSTELVTTFAEDVRTALRRLRKVAGGAIREGVPDRLREAWDAVDEYGSLLAEEALTDVVVFVEEHAAGESDLNGLDAIKELAVAQYHHRRARGFGSYAIEDSDNEYLPHRWRVLKRYVSSALYLDVSRESTGVLITDIIGMFAAGLAMLFATLALLLIQARWATDLSLAFVTSMVLAYIIKDRIKELAKRTLGRGLNRFLADHKIRVWGEGGSRLGAVKEWFAIRTVSDLPDDVQDLRFSDLDSHDAIEGRPESVMHYTKEIELSSPELSRQFAGATGLTDVTRLNMAPLMERMDDPWETYRFIHPSKHVIYQERCARVYHINVVLRLEDSEGKFELARARVVVSKKGIVRVEEASEETTAVAHQTADELAPIRLDDD